MKVYCAVDNRVAVDLTGFNLPIVQEKQKEILNERGVREIEPEINIVSLAREQIGKARWKRPSGIWEAPHFFDCASLIKWLFGQKGIRIPLLPIQQYEFCKHSGDLISLEQAEPGDLLFVNSPYVNGKKIEMPDRIGHVCLVSEDERAICATNSELGTGVIEISFEQLFKTRSLIGVGRIVPSNKRLTTLLTPPHIGIESSDDIKWILLNA